MKIVHLCLANYFTDGYSYQENELVKSQVRAGYEVVVVASTEKYLDNLTIGHVSPGRYLGPDGALVIRLPYLKFLPLAVAKKIRAHPGLYEILVEQKPNVVMFHGLAGWELRTVREYCRDHEDVLFFADCHADLNNSAKGFISKNILHKIFYKWVIHSCLPFINKVLCISIESMQFCKDIYGIHDNRLEFYPLGGRILEDDEYQKIRSRTRKKMGLKNTDVMFLQSGKFYAQKRVQDSLAAFLSINELGFKYFLVGSVPEDQLPQFKSAVARDSRVNYLGWKSSDELYELLCATDVYVQIGSQSATMQASLCARCAVILADVPSHKPFIDENGWLVTDVDSVVNAFREIENNPKILSVKGAKSLGVARRLLDYNKLSERLLEE